MKIAIGIDIGGTKTNLGLITPMGKIVECKRLLTNALEPQRLTEDLKQEIRKLTKDRHDICGIGLATAGRVNFKKKKVVYATDNIRGWASIPIAEILREEFSLPVYLENDVNAALLCDLKLHPEYAASPITIFLTIGTGLGGAIAINGQILRGQTGSVGEFGHMIFQPAGYHCNCGKQGCAEQYISGTAYQRILQAELKNLGHDFSPDDLTPATIEKQIFAGNKPYVKALNNMSQNLALLLESLKNCLDFDTCIIGGSFTVYEKLILKEVMHYFSNFQHKYLTLPKILFSAEGNFASVIGAGLLVFSQ